MGPLDILLQSNDFFIKFKFSKFVSDLLENLQKQPPEVFVKKVFLEFSLNSQENTCDRISVLIKLLALGLQLYLKRYSGIGVFL